MEEEHHYNTTVLFVDMAGYTARTSNLSRKELQEILEEFESVIKPAVKNFGGKIIKGMGDAFLVTFHSPTNSVLCGMEIQKRIEDRNQKPETKEKFEARVGISSGEVYERGGDIFGEPVNLASRVQSLAEGGQVVFSDSTYHAMNKNEFNIISLGKKALKGINDKREVYLANEKGKSSGLVKTKNLFGKIKSKWKWIVAIIVILLILSSGANNKENDNLRENWVPEAHSALQKQDIKTMESLLKIYEDNDANWKDFEKRILATRMYFSIGKEDRGIEELKNLFQIANPQQKEEILTTAKEKGIDVGAVFGIRNLEEQNINPLKENLKI